jgi:hypothetical protein
MYMTAKSGWTHRQVNISLGALGCEVHPAVLGQAAIFIMIEPRDLLDLKKAQHKLDKLMADSWPAVQ